MHDSDFEGIVLTPELDLNETEKLTKRARAKYLTHSITQGLLTIEDTQLKKSYTNTLYCAGVINYDEDTNKFVSKYCKNRWCLVCNRIKTAVNMNRYLPEIQTWETPFFVTLTIPNVPAKDLSNAIDKMIQTFANLKRVVVRNSKGTKFKAIRKLEVTYNPDRNDYHPHFHIITNGGEFASMIFDEWLKRYPDARDVAQDYRPANDGAVIELFKYFTKILSTKSAMKSKSLRDGMTHDTRMIYINALDNIFTAVKGKRTFQRFGFTIPKVEEKEEEDINIDKLDKKYQDLYRDAEFIWQQELSDWLNADTGELLSGYEVSESIKKLSESII